MASDMPLSSDEELLVTKEISIDDFFASAAENDDEATEGPSGIMPCSPHALLYCTVCVTSCYPVLYGMCHLMLYCAVLHVHSPFHFSQLTLQITAPLMKKRTKR